MGMSLVKKVSIKWMLIATGLVGKAILILNSVRINVEISGTIKTKIMRFHTHRRSAIWLLI